MKRIRNKAAALAAVLTVAGLGLVVAPAQPAHAIITCGTWRWPVKTGSDADRYRVSRTVRYTTVHHLRSLTAPSSFPTYYQNHRFRGAERHIWQLTTHLTQFREEDDGDIHLGAAQQRGQEDDRGDTARSLRVFQVAVEAPDCLGQDHLHQPLPRHHFLALREPVDHAPRHRLLR
ncbi:MAG TPA: hypothetical protein VGQ26_24440 [Streptosporangiaceae bacterium]|jgi:hypothetical protein|nr:hypothetical protein [Streptosporangiaceae bacterium]